MAKDRRLTLAPLAAAGFTAAAPDLRAMGYLEKTKDGYFKANVSELGFETVNLVGSAIGAMVAYAYAAVVGTSTCRGFGRGDHGALASGFVYVTFPT